MKSYSGYDPFNDDRPECIHGNVKRCEECEAEGAAIAEIERMEVIKERVSWFGYGALSVLIGLQLLFVFLGIKC